jgi:hypothetical protein
MATENIITVPFRLAFPEVFEPKAMKGSTNAKFSITMLFPKDGSSLIPAMPGNGVLELRKLALVATKEKWGEDKAKWPANLKSVDFKNYVSPTGKDGWPLRDGDMFDWDGFPGCIFTRASSQFQPGLVNSKLQPVINKSDVYGGLICRAQINAYAYDSNGNKGVTFGLNNLQILKDDGTIYGGRQNPAGVFDAFGEPGTTAAGSSEEEPW